MTRTAGGSRLDRLRGLLAGSRVPALGVAAAVGLVLYFVGALVAHLRVGSRQLTFAVAADGPATRHR